MRYPERGEETHRASERVTGRFSVISEGKKVIRVSRLRQSLLKSLHQVFNYIQVRFILHLCQKLRVDLAGIAAFDTGKCNHQCIDPKLSRKIKINMFQVDTLDSNKQL